MDLNNEHGAVLADLKLLLKSLQYNSLLKSCVLYPITSCSDVLGQYWFQQTLLIPSCFAILTGFLELAVLCLGSIEGEQAVVRQLKPERGWESLSREEQGGK